MTEDLAPTYWRMRAAEARALASNFSNSDTKREMRKIASDFEQIATTAERLEKSFSDLGMLDERDAGAGH